MVIVQPVAYLFSFLQADIPCRYEVYYLLVLPRYGLLRRRDGRVFSHVAELTWSGQSVQNSRIAH